MEETILTVDQVAQILQVHPFTVLKFIRQGRLKAAKLGRVYRLRRSDVEVFLDSLMGAPSKSSEPPREKKRKVSKSSAKAGAGKDVSPDSPLTSELKEAPLKADAPEDQETEKRPEEKNAPKVSGEPKTPPKVLKVELSSPPSDQVDEKTNVEDDDHDHYVINFTA
jgi:excisionase family DNA binding protein